MILIWSSPLQPSAKLDCIARKPQQNDQNPIITTGMDGLMEAVDSHYFWSGQSKKGSGPREKKEESRKLEGRRKEEALGNNKKKPVDVAVAVVESLWSFKSFI